MLSGEGGGKDRDRLLQGPGTFIYRGIREKGSGDVVSALCVERDR